MVLFENKNRNFRLILSITGTNHISYNLYNFGLSYIKRTKYDICCFCDYINAFTIDLIFIHFAIEWISAKKLYDEYDEEYK